MTESHDGDGSRQAAAEAEARLLWESVGALLLRLLTRKFGLPPDDAATLAQEAFVVYHGLDERPPDATGWLIAAASTNALAYLQRHGLPGGDAASDPQALARSLFDPALLDTLPQRARDALRLRYAEGKTYREIAEELDVSPYAVEHIVAKAIVSLRRRSRRE